MIPNRILFKNQIFAKIKIKIGSAQKRKIKYFLLNWNKVGFCEENYLEFVRSDLRFDFEFKAMEEEKLAPILKRLKFGVNAEVTVDKLQLVCFEMDISVST
jgi:hypothetical protein